MSEPGLQVRARDEGVTARLIRTEGDWDAVRPDWEALSAASPYAAPPLDFAWLRGWWRVYGPTYGTGGLQIVTVWRGTQLIGAFPLYEGGDDRGPLGLRQLRFLSTGEAEFEETCPDYLNPLCLRGEEEACLDALWACVDGLTWDQLELLDLPEESPLVRSRAPRGRMLTIRRGSCPIADLTGGFEEYLGRLSSNSRQQARRLLREGERAGAQLEVVTPDRADSAFDDLMRLHQARWTADGKPGVFSAPRFIAFHRDIIRTWLPDGRAVLARLSLDGEAIAVLYGFVTRVAGDVTGSRFDFYQSGVARDDAGLLRSPGNLAHLLLMRTLAERGVTAYDFLRGASSYKVRLATREHQMVAVQVWRPTLRAATYRSVQLVARVTRPARRLLFSNGTPR